MTPARVRPPWRSRSSWALKVSPWFRLEVLCGPVRSACSVVVAKFPHTDSPDSYTTTTTAPPQQGYSRVGVARRFLTRW